MEGGKGRGSLRVISKSLTFEETSSNIGIGGSFVPGVKLTVVNNPNSWKTTIFKNSQNSDYISIGNYDFNNNNNNYIASIDKSIDLFKDLYINNLGISSQPPSLIGNVIINGKTTIGNSSNDPITNNYILDINSRTSNNLLILRNSNSSLNFSVTNNNFSITTTSQSLFINSSLYINSNINSNSLNPLNPMMFIKGNSVLDGSLIIGSNNSNPLNPMMFIKGNSVLDGSLIIGSNNSNPLNPMMFIKGNSVLDGSLIIGSNNSNPLNPMMFIKGNSVLDGSLIIGSNNSNPLNPMMFIKGNSVLDGSLIIGSNNSNPLNPMMFIKGNSVLDGSLIIGSNNSSNIQSNLNFINRNNYYSILISSNTYINCNLDVNGIISGSIRTSSIILDENKKINGDLINIHSNSPIFFNESNQLSLNVDYSNSPLILNESNQLSFNINPEIFFITSNNQLSILGDINLDGGGGGTGESHWRSADLQNDPPELIFFNSGKSYVGINNDDPRSFLYVGLNGNLLRLATITDINDSYYSQIATNDNTTNTNNTKIKLIAPVQQSLLTGTNDISGSIYYNTTGNNPIHSFNYESNGIITPQMLINSNGTVFINPFLNTCNSSNTPDNGNIFVSTITQNSYFYNYNSNNDKLIVNGNILINSNDSLKVGSSIISNNYLNINGRVVIGTSNDESRGYSLYINEGHMKINSNLEVSSNVTINSNLRVNGLIDGKLKLSQLYLDDSNLKLNANFINIDSNTGINVNDSNQLIVKLDYSKFQINSSNEITITNSAVGSAWKSAVPFVNDPAEMTRIYFNKNESYVGINNDDPRSLLYVGANGNLLRLATISDINDSYYSQIATNDNTTNNNNTKIKLIAPVQQSLITGTSDISGSIYYNTTGANPIHSFNYESNGILTSQMLINSNGTIFINPSLSSGSNSSNDNAFFYNYNSNNDKLIVNGNILINSNDSLKVGSSIISNNYLNINGRIVIGTSNDESRGYSLYINEGHMKINSNLEVSSNVTINSNLRVNGLIDGKLKLSQLYLDDSNLKLNANFINIDSNTGINVNDSNQLIVKLDYSKFQINSSNEITIPNSAVGSAWNSAIPFVDDPTQMTRIYFNKNESYVGINNDDPRSLLYVGANGNLLRLATISDINDSYYSQIATNDNTTNNNNTKIKLIAPVQQSLLTGTSDISGSIYYNTTGANPIHSFNYESNGIITSQMLINSNGTIFINPSLSSGSNSSNDNAFFYNYNSNNDKLIVNGNILINSNDSLKVGSSIISNNYLNINGRVVIGTSNDESRGYSLYINEGHVRINSNLEVSSNVTINSNLIVNGVISGNGSNITNLKLSQLYLDDSNLKLNANFINIDSNTGINFNDSNQLIVKLDYSKFQINSSNEITIPNSSVATAWKSAIPFLDDPTQMTRIYFNKNESYVGINNDDPRSLLYVGANGNLLRLATISDINDSYYSQIATNDNTTNKNNTKIKLIAPVQQSLLTGTTDISGSIYYNTTGANPIHSFNYESNGIITSQMLINSNGTIFINPSLSSGSNSSNDNAFFYNYNSNNDKLIVNGNILINSNDSLKVGSSIISNNYLNINGRVVIGTSNDESRGYSLYINEGHIKINSNLEVGSNVTINSNLIVNGVTINSNLIVNGVISGNGSNITNLKLSQLYLDDSNLKLSGAFLNINSNTGINVNDSNQLIVKLDYSKFQINSNSEITIPNSAVGSAWLSAIPFIDDPKQMTRIYFNKNESYVGINNDDPRSLLHVGANGNLLRLATINDINDSYYSQIATNDTVNNTNNTKIKLIPPVPQSLLLTSNSYDQSGSIYYYTTGSNPVHAFNYESNGIITPLMNINKTGTVFINQNNRTIENNERLIIGGNVSILNSNLTIPPRVIIGENNDSNAVLQMNGRIVIGKSNIDASTYGLYVNSNVKINSNIVINGNILGYNPVNFNNTVSIGTTSTTPIIDQTGVNYILNVNGNVALNGIINTSSDKRLKSNIRTYENSLDKILNCRGVSFNYNNESNSSIGVIAQELEEVFPELVSVNNDGYKNVNYIGIIGVLIEAIKELNRKIEKN